jgi:hypothetical protein
MRLGSRPGALVTRRAGSAVRTSLQCHSTSLTPQVCRIRETRTAASETRQQELGWYEAALLMSLSLVRCAILATVPVIIHHRGAVEVCGSLAENKRAGRGADGASSVRADQTHTAHVPIPVAVEAECLDRRRGPLPDRRS